MASQFKITGIGPKNAAGGLLIFTVLPTPFKVSAEWLTEQGRMPEVDDAVEMDSNGSIKLLTVEKPAIDTIVDKVEAQEPEKKSLGSAGSAIFSSYQGKPIIVHASEITAVGEADSDGNRELTLAGGGTRIATADMMSRMVPVSGDYWVIVPQADGNYEYINPKAVFEAKYSPIEQ